jgi:hypothetical protein
MGELGLNEIHRFLEELGRQYRLPTTLFVIGGGAVCLLGSPRLTLDFDYVGDDLVKDDLQQTIEGIARKLQIRVEAVPIERFIPLPKGAEERHLFVGRYGLIDVFVFDPYSIALSKVERGFDTDIDDVLFLLRQNVVDFNQLESIVVSALDQAAEFDMDKTATLDHLEEVRRRLTAR